MTVMPVFARKIAEVLPLTYFRRIVPGILLRGEVFLRRPQVTAQAGAPFHFVRSG